MTGSTRKTTHTVDPGSTIAARPNPQPGDKIGTVSVEPNPNNENGSTLFKRNTVQKTGRGTKPPNQDVIPPPINGTMIDKNSATGPSGS